MHSVAIRNEFLRLRVQGLSLACIGRRLGVSKPTLIAWSRRCQPDIDSRILEDQQRVQQEITASADQQLADLTRKLNALKQELFSRALRDCPTPQLEALAGQLRQRIEHLESAKPPTPPPRSADLQSAVSPICNRQGTDISTNPQLHESNNPPLLPRAGVAPNRT